MLRFLAAPVLVVALQASPGTLAAQDRSSVSGADLQSAITDTRAENSAAILQFLQSDRVIETAKSMGVRTETLSAKVASLDDATLNQVAERTHAAELGLAGGERYLLISTTAIIIILLILILVT